MPEDYTPTEVDVRHYFARAFRKIGILDGEERFDRWLAVHDAEVRAEERAKRPDREHLKAAVRSGFQAAAQSELRVGIIAAVTPVDAVTDAVLSSLALEPEAREEPEDDESDPSLDDCPACDTALSDCAPDAACCEGCSHVHNWPAPEAREVTDATVDIADEVYGDELTRALREDLGQTVGNVRRRAMRAALEAAAAVTDG